VYALGTLGYDFSTEAHRNSFKQQNRDELGVDLIGFGRADCGI
jgi:hypothetical protein